MRLGPSLQVASVLLQLAGPVAQGASYSSVRHIFGETALPCTDDSDCVALGHKFGCFLYRWVQTLMVAIPPLQGV